MRDTPAAAAVLVAVLVAAADHRPDARLLARPRIGGVVTILVRAVPAVVGWSGNAGVLRIRRQELA